MKNFRNFILSGIFVCGFLTVPVAHAANADNLKSDPAGFSQKRHEGKEGRSQEIFNELKLSDQQKQQLDDNKAKSRKQMEATLEKMRSFREALNQELMKSALDMNKINEIQVQIKAVQAEMVDGHLQSILEVRKILTPEQFTKFLLMMDKRGLRPHPKAAQGKGL